MSKNIYRVTKKSDLDEIIKNNFLKPICIIFINDSISSNLIDEIALTLKEIAKKNTYSMFLIVNLDKFIDNINFFDDMKKNLPCLISYFKGKQLVMIHEKENFIPIITNVIDKINNSYIHKLTTLFNENNKQENTQENVQENVQENKKKIKLIMMIINL